MEEEGRWVLRRGKQMLVGSLLASAAPVVVPPLVVVSVIGISVAIPFGIFFATHVCTHKLMTKLLPMPPAVHTPSSYPHHLQVCHKQTTGQSIGMGEAADNHNHIFASYMQPLPSDESNGLNQDSSSPVAHVHNSSPSTTNNDDEVPPVNEEKLWREINAIRVIVGYEGTSQESCMDELKKLYVLAGVEPPSLLTASANSYQILHHLRFLMSILGVKSNDP